MTFYWHSSWFIPGNTIVPKSFTLANSLPVFASEIRYQDPPLYSILCKIRGPALAGLHANTWYDDCENTPLYSYHPKASGIAHCCHHYCICHVCELTVLWELLIFLEAWVGSWSPAMTPGAWIWPVSKLKFWQAVCGSGSVKRVFLAFFTVSFCSSQ